MSTDSTAFQRRDPSAANSAFIECARAVARLGDVDAKLQALAGQARALTGASASVIYLVESPSGALLPAASDGIDADELAGPPELLARSITEGLDPDDPLARVMRERRPELVPGGERRGGILGRPGVQVAAYAPLIATDTERGQEVEGVVAVAFESPPDEPDAALSLIGAVADLAAVAVRQSRLERALAERSDWLDRVAQTDPLTGLANRRTFDRVLELELLRAARQGTPVSVALFDIDGFEPLNKKHGASKGDDVLRRVASTLGDTVRLVDTVARYGSDEFAVVAPGAAGRSVAQRVVSAVTGLDALATGEPISVRAGVARFPDHGTTGQELVTAAAAALEQAKQQGRDVVEPPAAATTSG